MPPGKIAAQTGHAFLDSYLNSLKSNPERAELYRSPHHGTKVVLVAPTLNELMQSYHLATDLGINCVLIQDSGHILPPHFLGQPIITALGIGPSLRSEVSLITKRFKLL